MEAERCSCVGCLPLTARNINPNSMELVNHIEEERRLAYVRCCKFSTGFSHELLTSNFAKDACL
eukprot:6209962-Pleurochrysis_carterae.AAC.1